MAAARPLETDIVLPLLVLFIVAPLAELYVLIRVGGAIGAAPTILLAVLTAILGTVLVRRQGFAVLRRIHEAMGRDEVPALEMLDGALLLIAGMLLLVPGFISDALGCALLVPPLRRRLIAHYVEIVPVRPDHRPPSWDEGAAGRRIIDGDYRRERD